MNTIKRFFHNLDLGLLILRLVPACLMLFHGFKKIQTPVESYHQLANDIATIHMPGFLAMSYPITQILAPILLILGWKSRVMAFLIAGTMVMATLAVYSDVIFSTNPETGALAIEVQMFYFLTSLAIMFTGGGKYAVSKNHWLD